MSGTPDRSTTLTQSVSRALAVLSCFTDSSPQLRVGDIAAQIDLPQSTVSRLLKTMEQIGFVERDDVTGLYRPGLELVTLAGIVLNQIPLRAEAMLELSTVATDTGLATNLAILRNDRLFYLATVEGPKAPKQFTMIGKSGPLHCTGMGKVLLAHLAADERETVLSRLPFEQFTSHTATSVDDLRPMLDRVQRDGYAIEREELALGRACLASPIRDARGKVVAATSISGPLSALDLNHREAELASRVIEMADSISRRLGYIATPRAGVSGSGSPAKVAG